MSQFFPPQRAFVQVRHRQGIARPEGFGWATLGAMDLIDGGRDGEPADPRVDAVLAVLAGQPVAAVAQRWDVDAALVHRWVKAFVDAGTAQVTNTPDPEAAAQRDRFLAAFNHELRTPLAVARGWATMLEDEEVPPAAVAATVRKLRDSLDQLADRVADTELLAAAALGRLRVHPEPVGVAELVDGLLDPDEVEGADLVVTVDPRLFRRVLADLWAAGASWPTPRSRRLEVVVTPPWIELRVVRRADPIDHDVLRALFEPFDANSDGTGVSFGLYLARALVIAHKGTLGVDQDDEGAALWVRIPH